MKNKKAKNSKKHKNGIARKIIKHPLTKEYVGKQKSLTKDTLKKVAKLAEKGINKFLNKLKWF